jgi:RNA polymerase sigma factor (sigma-70 family)
MNHCLRFPSAATPHPSTIRPIFITPKGSISMNKPQSFESILAQNKRRIHYQIHKLNIRDPEQEFFQEGIIAMWNAYEQYDPDKGLMATYFNYTIRNRLIDFIRQKQQYQSHFTRSIQENHHKETSSPHAPFSELLLDNPTLYEKLKTHLTQNQRKWLYYAVINEMPLKEIAAQEDTTVEAVKGWGRLVRNKLRTEPLNGILSEALQN